ncbi:MAG: hypothetical protein EOP50_15675 [Sphingobacteriales bacterium]|nr:MAG: hypothetical protein EOP50_15675 [Sphingobacteriales bacterium]
MKFFTSFALASTIFLGGCATGGFVGILVDQKAPTPDIALLKPLEGVIVESIDGRGVSVMAGVAGHAHDYEIGLKPGRHSAVVRYLYVFQGALTTITAGPVSVDFDVEAGHRYLIKPNLARRGPGEVAWEPYVMDMTGNEKCWSVFLEMGFFYRKQPECTEAALAKKKN